MRATILIMFVIMCTAFQVVAQTHKDTAQVISYQMNYPVDARRNGIQGTVKIKVTFDAQCNVTKREVVKSLGYGCDEEALAAMKNLEPKIKKTRKGNCKDGEELTYPFEFRLD